VRIFFLHETTATLHLRTSMPEPDWNRTQLQQPPFAHLQPPRAHRQREPAQLRHAQQPSPEKKTNLHQFASTIADARQLHHLCSSFNIQPAPVKCAQQPPRWKTAAAAVIAPAQPREEGGRSSKP